MKSLWCSQPCSTWWLVSLKQERRLNLASNMAQTGQPRCLWATSSLADSKLISSSPCSLYCDRTMSRTIAPELLDWTGDCQFWVSLHRKIWSAIAAAWASFQARNPGFRLAFAGARQTTAWFESWESCWSRRPVDSAARIVADNWALSERKRHCREVLLHSNCFHPRALFCAPAKGSLLPW